MKHPPTALSTFFSPLARKQKNVFTLSRKAEGLKTAEEKPTAWHMGSRLP